MALVERKTRKIEVCEAHGCDIHVRETTHIVDDETGEVVHPNISHHRYVIPVNGDIEAAAQGLQSIADFAWTPNLRAAAQARQDEITAAEQRQAEAEAKAAQAQARAEKLAIATDEAVAKAEAAEAALSAEKASAKLQES
jgi:hypothetical protein